MKRFIKTLLREGLTENFGYRSGDLINKAETTANGFRLGGRHTGHFGTGYYFFSDKAKADAYDDRETTKIPLDGYNLTKGTVELHGLLKDVNDSAIGFGKDENELSWSIKHVLNHFNQLEKAVSTINPRNSRESAALSPEEKELMHKEIGNFIVIDKRNEQKIKEIMSMISSDTSGDTPSTVLMKYMGFDGVDSRGTELDKPQYGSVIYDIK